MNTIQEKNASITSLSSYSETVISSSIKIRRFGGALKQIILSDASSDSNGLIVKLTSDLMPTSDLNQNTIVRGASSTFYLVRIYPDGDVMLVTLTGSPATSVSSIVGTIMYS